MFMHCLLHATGAHNLLEIQWCLTNDGLQRQAQSPGETSSSLTGDEIDDGGSLLMGSRWANQKLCHCGLSKFMQM